MLCSHAKNVQGPTGTRSNLVGSHFVRVLFWRFRSCGYGFWYCCSAAAAAAAAKARLLLLLMMSVIGEEVARHTLLDGEHFYTCKPEICLSSA